MMGPTLQEEKKLWKKGYKRVAGLDEVGRGPLAGPVVAAAVTLSPLPNFKRFWPSGVNDSKKLNPERRRELYKMLTKNPGIRWGLGRVSEKVIDKINILEATRLAMEKAIHNLQKTDPCKSKIDFIILDGKMSLDVNIPQKSIIRADEKIFSCAAASIIAKVKRDCLMEKYAKKYPYYSFDRHKGYGTKHHLRMLKKYGTCAIHRKSFHYGRSQAKTHQIKKK